MAHSGTAGSGDAEVWTRTFTEEVTGVLARIESTDALSVRDRVMLLEKCAALFKEALRLNRTRFRTNEFGAPDANHRHALEVLRRLRADRRDPRQMSDEEFLLIRNVGIKTLVSIRSILGRDD